MYGTQKCTKLYKRGQNCFDSIVLSAVYQLLRLNKSVGNKSHDSLLRDPYTESALFPVCGPYPDSSPMSLESTWPPTMEGGSFLLMLFMQTRCSLFRVCLFLPPQVYERGTNVDQFVTRFLLKETANQIQSLLSSVESAVDAIDEQTSQIRLVSSDSLSFAPS